MILFLQTFKVITNKQTKQNISYKHVSLVEWAVNSTDCNWMIILPKYFVIIV